MSRCVRCLPRTVSATLYCPSVVEAAGKRESRWTAVALLVDIQAFTIRQSSLTGEKEGADRLGNPHIFSLLNGYFQPNTKSATFQNWV